MSAQQSSRDNLPAGAARWRFNSGLHWAKAVFPTPGEAPIDPLAPALQAKPRLAAAHIDVDNGVRQPRRLCFISAALRQCRGWLISAVVHAVALVALALLCLPGLVLPHDVYLIGQTPASADGPLDQFQIGSAAANRSSAVGFTLRADVTQTSVQPAQVRSLPLETLSRVPGFDCGPLRDVLDMPTDRVVELSDSADQRSLGVAEFFGVQAIGQRFVFVIDCSLSMAGLKWQMACLELEDAIDRLKEDQFFYVIFFDGDSYPMFGQNIRHSALEQATPENIDQLKAWFSTVYLGHNTSPCQSIKHAIQLQPDAVFLLSDGAFDDPTAPYLRKHNRGNANSQRVVVHTLCFGNRQGERMLKRIAAENGGTYRFVP